MALRDQPYIPLYVQDFLTDEKLIECSAKATGVYIRLMCIMHKSEEYGTILLKQKDKQSTNQIENFALKLVKQMPYSIDDIRDGINELVSEQVVVIEGDFLKQKRMIYDNSLSIKRANAGSKGGKFAQAKIKANSQANTENEIENVNEDEIKTKNSKLEIFQTLFGDDIFIEQLNRTHKGKDLKQAFEECYTHHSNAPNPPQELWEWKQKLNTWLTIKKPENGLTKKEQQNRSNISAFAARVIERNKGQ